MISCLPHQHYYQGLPDIRRTILTASVLRMKSVRICLQKIFTNSGKHDQYWCMSKSIPMKNSKWANIASIWNKKSVTILFHKTFMIVEYWRVRTQISVESSDQTWLMNIMRYSVEEVYESVNVSKYFKMCFLEPVVNLIKYFNNNKNWNLWQMRQKHSATVAVPSTQLRKYDL